MRASKTKKPDTYEYPDPFDVRRLDPQEPDSVAVRRRIHLPTLSPPPPPPPVFAKDDLLFVTAPGTHTPVCVLHGPGGTGKTFRIRQYQEQHPQTKILMTANTGVAAINIGPGAITVNSAFKFFKDESLIERLANKFNSTMAMVRDHDILVIDEMSMLSSTRLDLIYGAIESVNRQQESKIKLVLCGDFCQLPPIVEARQAIPFAFKGQHWKRVFEPAVIKLTQNYRQANDPQFIHALIACRTGDTQGCIAALEGQVSYAKVVDMAFKGLTLYSINKDVDAHNTIKLRELGTETIISRARTWGATLIEWKDILDPLYLKIGAQVRVTANDVPSFEYVNGDIGELIEFQDNVKAVVRLNRNNATLCVTAVQRLNTRPREINEPVPAICNGRAVPTKWEKADDKKRLQDYVKESLDEMKPFYDPLLDKWVIGWINYVPITLGWASTIHKAQGLTVDMLQIDIDHRYSGNPQMMYVALSRCKSAKNIVITRGGPSELANRIRCHPDLKPYQ